MAHEYNLGNALNTIITLNNGTVITNFQSLKTFVAGSGVLDSLVCLEAPGSAPTEQGNNTSDAPQFNELPGSFTHPSQFSQLATITLGGVQYLGFTLDIDQKSSNPLLSLNALPYGPLLVISMQK